MQPPHRPVREGDTGPVARHARLVARPRGLGGKGATTLEIVEYERPNRLRTVIRSSSMQVHGTFTFEDVDGATRLTWAWDMDLLEAMRLLAPALAVAGPVLGRRDSVGPEDPESARR